MRHFVQNTTRDSIFSRAWATYLLILGFIFLVTTGTANAVTSTSKAAVSKTQLLKKAQVSKARAQAAARAKAQAIAKARAVAQVKAQAKARAQAAARAKAQAIAKARAAARVKAQAKARAQAKAQSKARAQAAQPKVQLRRSATSGPKKQVTEQAKMDAIKRSRSQTSVRSQPSRNNLVKQKTKLISKTKIGQQGKFVAGRSKSTTKKLLGGKKRIANTRKSARKEIKTVSKSVPTIKKDRKKKSAKTKFVLPTEQEILDAYRRQAQAEQEGADNSNPYNKNGYINRSQIHRDAEIVFRSDTAAMGVDPKIVKAAIDKAKENGRFNPYVANHYLQTITDTLRNDALSGGTASNDPDSTEKIIRELTGPGVRPGSDEEKKIIKKTQTKLLEGTGIPAGPQSGREKLTGTDPSSMIDRAGEVQDFGGDVHDPEDYQKLDHAKKKIEEMRRNGASKEDIANEWKKLAEQLQDLPPSSLGSTPGDDSSGSGNGDAPGDGEGNGNGNGNEVGSGAGNDAGYDAGNDAGNEDLPEKLTTSTINTSHGFHWKVYSVNNDDGSTTVYAEGDADTRAEAKRLADEAARKLRKEEEARKRKEEARKRKEEADAERKRQEERDKEEEDKKAKDKKDKKSGTMPIDPYYDDGNPELGTNAEAIRARKQAKKGIEMGGEGNSDAVGQNILQSDGGPLISPHFGNDVDFQDMPAGGNGPDNNPLLNHNQVNGNDLTQQLTGKPSDNTNNGASPDATEFGNTANTPVQRALRSVPFSVIPTERPGKGESQKPIIKSIDKNQDLYMINGGIYGNQINGITVFEDNVQVPQSRILQVSNDHIVVRYGSNHDIHQVRVVVGQSSSQGFGF